MPSACTKNKHDKEDGGEAAAKQSDKGESVFISSLTSAQDNNCSNILNGKMNL
jgi:hypothetical protein